MWAATHQQDLASSAFEGQYAIRAELPAFASPPGASRLPPIGRVTSRRLVGGVCLRPTTFGLVAVERGLLWTARALFHNADNLHYVNLKSGYLYFLHMVNKRVMALRVSNVEW